MIAALLLASAPVTPQPKTAVDAEIAFARDAKRVGQWTAFRRWADRDAVMFTPQAVWARTFLKRLKDPPKSISWRPAQSFVSCDGRTAVNTGPWFTQDSRLAGHFTTVWQRTAGSWRWVYDGGVPAPGKGVGHTTLRTRVASCSAAPGAPVVAPAKLNPKQALTTPQDTGRGESADKTLGWQWKVTAQGTRSFRVFLWNGRRYDQVIDATAPAPRGK
jgi:hypothetical protein